MTDRARAEVLGRIRRAVATARPDAAQERALISREYQRSSVLDRDARIDLFASRIEHYDGRVMRSAAADLPGTIASVLAARGRTRLHVPADLDEAWLPRQVTFVADTGVSAEELDRSEGVMTGCTVAIATTGTIVLTHSRGEGRRALTLVPDYHLSIVFAEQIVETVPEAMQRIVALRPSLITTISGPSATADIEMTRIKGVHGPRMLDVILVTPDR